jgi:hypothetical protein
MDTASTTSVSEESLTSARTSIPGNSTSSIALLATAANILPKRSLVHAHDLAIHGTEARALNFLTSCSAVPQTCSPWILTSR